MSIDYIKNEIIKVAIERKDEKLSDFLRDYLAKADNNREKLSNLYDVLKTQGYIKTN